MLTLAHPLWVRKAVGLLEWIKSGDGSSGKSAGNMQEWVKVGAHIHTSYVDLDLMIEKSSSNGFATPT